MCPVGGISKVNVRPEESLAEDQDHAGAEGGEAPAARRPVPRTVMFVALGVVGAGLGAWLGGPLIAPMLAGVLAGGGEPEAAGESGGGHGGGGGGGEAEAATLPIDDLVVNPAGSGGTRFLVAALALEASPEAQEALGLREAEARDLLLTVLASRTVEELSDVSFREEIRAEIAGALNHMLGFEGVHRVFFPQFVIQ